VVQFWQSATLPSIPRANVDQKSRRVEKISMKTVSHWKFWLYCFLLLFTLLFVLVLALVFLLFLLIPLLFALPILVCYTPCVTLPIPFPNGTRVVRADVVRAAPLVTLPKPFPNGACVVRVAPRVTLSRPFPNGRPFLCEVSFASQSLVLALCLTLLKTLKTNGL
jgi:hypothetical protein